MPEVLDVNNGDAKVGVRRGRILLMVSVKEIDLTNGGRT